MRARSSWMSHPKFKATWVALAAGSLAGLAVLGACSDAPVSKVAGPNIPSAPRFTGTIGALNHVVQVCVDPTGAAAPGGGTYSFAVVRDTSTVAPLGHTAFGQRHELPDVGLDPDLSAGFITQNTRGPYVPGDKVFSASIALGDPCKDVFVRMNTCPGSDPTANPPVLGTCGADPLDNAGNRLWTCGAGSGCSGIINPSGAVKITATIPAGYSYSISCVNEDVNLPQSCVNGGWASANVFHGGSFTFKFTAPTGVCVAPNAFFGLGAAAPFTVLGLAGASMNAGIGTGVFGDFGVGPNDTGKLDKLKINGTFAVDPTATTQIGNVTYTTKTTPNLTTPSANAVSASAALWALAPTQAAIPTITNNITINLAAGNNVIPVAGVNVNKKTITINGGVNDVVVFNVTGGFQFNSSKIVLTGGLQASNVLWNFNGTGAVINIENASSVAQGIFLAPLRNFTVDHASLFGYAYIGGTFLLHSSGIVNCQAV